jgi:hypothetical protein
LGETMTSGKRRALRRTDGRKDGECRKMMRAHVRARRHGRLTGGSSDREPPALPIKRMSLRRLLDADELLLLGDRTDENPIPYLAFQFIQQYAMDERFILAGKRS